MTDYSDLFSNAEDDALLRELEGNLLWLWEPMSPHDSRPVQASNAPFRAAQRIRKLEAALRHYSCGCKENECKVKPRYAPLKCGWPARQALEGK